MLHLHPRNSLQVLCLLEKHIDWDGSKPVPPSFLPSSYLDDEVSKCGEGEEHVEATEEGQEGVGGPPSPPQPPGSAQGLGVHMYIGG